MLYLTIWFALILLRGLITGQASSPYAPTVVTCPEDLQIRPAYEGLSYQEQEWRQRRMEQVIKSLSGYLNTANIPGFQPDAYLNGLNTSTAPVAGLAISGGGSQSGMTGLGLWQTFDDRSLPAVEAGTGGLAQCLSYLTGLSGGGLNTVIPLASNNFSSVSELRTNVNLTVDFLIGPAGNQTAHFAASFENTYAKLRSGFPVSVTDVFGQFYRQYLPKDWGYKDFSDVADVGQAFTTGLAPMPIVLYTEVLPGSSPTIGDIMYPDVNSKSLTSYEQTPFEFGSWIGGRVQAFMPTRFLGSAMSCGMPVHSNHCVNGFDKMTFAQGSTGNAWNFWLIDAFYNVGLFYKRDRVSQHARMDAASSIPIPQNQLHNQQVILINETASVFNQTFNQSMWATYPNPFLNFNEEMRDQTELLLADGSETGETIPLRPLIIPQRRVDFIIAYDSSGENLGNGWVNGTTFAQTAAAARLYNIPFPNVPTSATFVNLRLNRYPTFFGCKASQATPLVLYVPNAPWSAYTNYTFTTSAFTDAQLDLVFNNSLSTMTLGHGEFDAGPGVPAFPACIACGLIYKSLLRIGEKIPDSCQACFDAHCWNGTEAETPENPSYDPSLFLDPTVGYRVWNETVWN